MNDDLATMTAFPVHIIWGSDDEWQALEWAHKLHAAVPGSTLTVIDDAGHFCMEDRPDAVASAILEGLRVPSRTLGTTGSLTGH